MSFKKIRSLIGRLFSEKQQMIIILWLSEIFWSLRKYFLGVEIEYPDEFLKNWKDIKNKSSQDRERNFTVYQLVKLHNKLFSEKQTNVIEFGTDRGGALTTICKFIKGNSNIYSVDSFGLYAKKIKENVSKYDKHYHGKYEPFTINTRFKNFSYTQMRDVLNQILLKKSSRLETLVGHFPNLEKKDMDKIVNLKFSFVHLDLDLYQSTIDTFNFVKNRLEKSAIILFDDYNFINQEGIKKAVKDLGIDLDRGIQTQSGQLIFFT